MKPTENCALNEERFMKKCLKKVIASPPARSMAELRIFRRFDRPDKPSALGEARARATRTSDHTFAYSVISQWGEMGGRMGAPPLSYKALRRAILRSGAARENRGFIILGTMNRTHL